MIFISHYDSPLGMIEIAAGEDGLKGVWFEGQKYFAAGLKENETCLLYTSPSPRDH